MISRATIAELLEPGLANVFFNEIEEHPEYVKDLYQVKKSEKQFEEDLLVVGLGIMPEKTEGDAVTYDDLIQGWLTRYTHTTFGGAVKITQEMYEDDLYGVMQDMTKALARSARQRRNVDCAATFNNAFSSSYAGADGVALISASHPLKAGGTQSNTLATATVDLSVSSLQDALTVLETTLDERSLNLSIRGKKLLVHPNQSYVAFELVKSMYKPGVADNEVNVLAHKGLEVVVNPFLTDQDAWFIIGDQNKLMWYDRRELTFGKGDDFDTDNIKFKASMRYSKGFSDWRGIIGDAGA